MAKSVSFKGKSYNKKNVDKESLAYIKLLEKSSSQKTKASSDKDLDFRMNQTLQMFGAEVVSEQTESTIKLNKDK